MLEEIWKLSNDVQMKFLTPLWFRHDVRVGGMRKKGTRGPYFLSEFQKHDSMFDAGAGMVNVSVFCWCNKLIGDPETKSAPFQAKHLA